MNILDIQDKLKGLSQDQLAQEMQMPSGQVPQFLVLGEMNRRQSMRQSMQQQGAGSQTVAQELLNGAGIPAEGMSDMAGAMAPKSSIAQNTGIGALPQEALPSQQAGIESLAATGMYAGGRVTKMAGGSNGAIDRNSYTLPQIIGGGLSDLSDWWNSGPTYAPRLNPRDPLIEIDPETGEPIPQQSPVDPREANAITAPVAPVTAPAADPFAAPQTTTTSSSGSGGSGASSGKMSTYEQMLADAMANAEKKAKQDKWLALAQAGMALMSSTSGSFAGALGEAGKVGIEALQSARDTGAATQLQLAKEQFGIDQDREARARSAASAGRPKPRTASGILSEISSINEILSSMTQKDEMGMPIPPDDATLATMADLKAQADALIAEYGRIQSSGFDLSDVPQ
jgi:hypothetical protein